MPVNIVYPIDGETYPKTDPAPGALSSAYLTFSFSVTRSGGPTTVQWGVDGDTLGEARFYDMYSAQFVWKVGGGKHKFWVDAGGAGSDSVTFKAGN